MTAQQVTDRDLVRQAQAGERQAFAELVARYQRRAYAVALGMVHNHDDALDVVQDAFVKAHRNLPGFQGKSSFYTWLYRIVVNLCIDRGRSRSRRPQVEFDETYEREQAASVGVDVLPSRSDADPIRNMKRRELGQQLEKALSSLSDNHRAILLLREVDGCSYEQIAETLDISKGTVMSRLFHARKNMQKELRPYLGLEEGQGLDGRVAQSEDVARNKKVEQRADTTAAVDSPPSV